MTRNIREGVCTLREPAVSYLSQIRRGIIFSFIYVKIGRSDSLGNFLFLGSLNFKKKKN